MESLDTPRIIMGCLPCSATISHHWLDFSSKCQGGSYRSMNRFHLARGLSKCRSPPSKGKLMSWSSIFLLLQLKSQTFRCILYRANSSWKNMGIFSPTLIHSALLDPLISTLLNGSKYSLFDSSDGWSNSISAEFLSWISASECWIMPQFCCCYLGVNWAYADLQNWTDCTFSGLRDWANSGRFSGLFLGCFWTTLSLFAIFGMRLQVLATRHPQGCCMALNWTELTAISTWFLHCPVAVDLVCWRIAGKCPEVAALNRGRFVAVVGPLFLIFSWQVWLGWGSSGNSLPFGNVIVHISFFGLAKGCLGGELFNWAW